MLARVLSKRFGSMAVQRRALSDSVGVLTSSSASSQAFAASHTREDTKRLRILVEQADAAMRAHLQRGTKGVFWDELTALTVHRDILRARELVDRVSKLEGAEERTVDDVMGVFEAQDLMRRYLVALETLPLPETRVIGSGKQLKPSKKATKEKPRVLIAEDQMNVTEEILEKRKQALLESVSMKNILGGFHSALLDIETVAKVTRGGTRVSQRVVVAVGDRQGTAGYGVGKGDSVPVATQRACRDARRNLLRLDLYHRRTLFHRCKGSFVCAKVEVWPLGPGRGLRANADFAIIMSLFGMQDAGAKLHSSSRAKVNTIKALFSALASHRSADDVAMARGLTLPISG
mmetsp:Transcript_17747/g.36850  ORF Transcript_17747/g.36850 Transcript_17747/m.36850 type:complete len:347 (-) Transcript_17747:622-1662(-)